MGSILTLFLVSLAIAAPATYAVRSASRRLGLVAAPRDDRWHRRPTALMGGLAIFFASAVSLALFAPQMGRFWCIFAAASLLFGVGLVDDIRPLRPYAKLTFQVLAAAIVLSCNIVLPWGSSELINILFTIFWLVGITNALNLLDNMDGLAAGIAAIAAAFLGVTFILNGQIAEAGAAAVIVGAAMGFLLFNRYPASIFMGDCGSMFLGFSLGGLALLSDYGRTRNLMAVLITPVLILLAPIFDTCVVTVTRKISGRAVSQGGRDHVSHRLVALGVAEPQAVRIFYLFAFISGLLALSLRFFGSEISLLMIPGFALSVLLLGFYVGQVRIYEQEPDELGAAVRVMKNFSHKRRVFEVTLDAVLILLAYYGAYLIRWDGDVPGDQREIFRRTLPLVLGGQLVLFLASGLYRGLWRYTGVKDVLGYLKAVGFASIVTTLAVFVGYKFQGPSRGVFVLDGLLLLVFLTASRFSFLMIRELVRGARTAPVGSIPVLIYGAGDRGELFLRETFNGHFPNYTVLGFIDDDDLKIGKVIHGHKIFSPRDVAKIFGPDGWGEIILSNDHIPAERIEAIRVEGITVRVLRIALGNYGPAAINRADDGRARAINQVSAS